ncbi:VOC family protein [Marimonas arenosa]|uniref:VOC family protein n=1 Tax=Marimonas arenosa TaxID=1795305 RepID=A0AAE4B4Y6_9RHOB|nr:VOC family protein [Marimonas arenosa]MDQ2091533.1 VOC family protein [Marimonas arenosa]
MAVVRIVADLEAARPAEVAAFYQQVFGLETAMDQGFFVTLAGRGAGQRVQLSLASAGGSGTPVPALSIEVDDLADTMARAAALGVEPEYGPVDEPWGVRRFFLRDPAGHLINVLTHAPEGAD